MRPISCIVASILLSVSANSRAEVGSDLPDYVGTTPASHPDVMRFGYETIVHFELANIGEIPAINRGYVDARFVLVPTSGPATPITVGWSILSRNPVFYTTTRLDAPSTGSETASRVLHLPPGTSPGNYRLDVIIDPNDEFPECDETNNTFNIAPSVNVFPVPDLELTPTNGTPLTLDAGQSFTINGRVSNTAAFVDIPPFLIDYYLVPPSAVTNLSTPRFIRSESHFLGRTLSDEFTSGQQFSPGTLFFTAGFNLPSVLEEELYRVGVHIDPENSVPEVLNMSHAETSNAFLLDDSKTVAVTYVRDRPDYTFSNNHTGFTPTTSPAGELVTFSGRALNITGFSTTQVTSIQHFLVKSGIPGGRLIGTSFLTPIAPTGHQDFSATFRLPVNLPPGTYNYSFLIDAANVIPERNEHNNEGYSGFSSTIEITPPELPDLTTDSNPGGFSPDPVDPGDSVFLTSRIANAGYSDSPPFDLQVRLSADTVIGDSDDFTLVTLNRSTALEPGGVHAFGTLVNLPANILPGTYRLYWRIDPDDEVEEVDNANNTHVVAPTLLTISAPPIQLADLRFTSLNLLGTGSHGETINIRPTLSNLGDGRSELSTSTVILTSDTIVGNDDDVVLDPISIPAVLAGDNSELSVNPTLPTDTKILPTGRYFFALTADPDNNVVESSETNNTTVFTSAPITIRPSDPANYPDLLIGNAGATPMIASAGTTLSHFVSIKNIGISPAGGIVTSLVLSPDTIIGNADDLTLATYGPEFLDHEMSVDYSDDVRLPSESELPPGTYTLAWIVDPLDTIPETASKNNLATMELHIGNFPLSLDIIDPKLEAIVLSLSHTEQGVLYYIESSPDLGDNWRAITSELPGDPDHPLIFELPPISLSSKAAAIYLRAAAE